MAQIADRRILVTGATGFTGRALVPALRSAGWWVRATGRSDAVAAGPGRADEFLRCDLTAEDDLRRLVDGTSAVVHLAARVHVMHDRASDPLAAFREANVAATARLADAAACSGVQQFVFASSIKVNGEGHGEQPYREVDVPAPEDSYGRSKLEAEQALAQHSNGAMSVTILRPPLMYGPGVKGNFARLVHLVRRGLPIPLGSATNRRSLLFVGNFCAAVVACLERPVRGKRLYLVSDREDISVRELLQRIGRAVGRPARLVPFPSSLLRAIAAVAGMQDEVQRLTEPLLLDSSLICAELQWTPPYSIDEGLALTAKSLA